MAAPPLNWTVECSVDPITGDWVFGIATETGPRATLRISYPLMRLLQVMRPTDVYESRLDPYLAQSFEQPGENAGGQSDGPFPSFLVTLSCDGFHSKVEYGIDGNIGLQISQCDADHVSGRSAGSERHELDQVVLHLGADLYGSGEQIQSVESVEPIKGSL